MKIDGIIWLPDIVDKLLWKHHVSQNEVGEVFYNHPMFRKLQNGHVPGEHLYSALGESDTGRKIIVFFIYKQNHKALIISVRDMDKTERKQYERK